MVPLPLTALPYWSSTWTAKLAMVAPALVEAGWGVKASRLDAPATSVKVPKLVEPVMPLIVDVPDSVMSPDANGVPAAGRT